MAVTGATPQGLTPERALILMQLVSAGDRGLLLSDVAGFGAAGSQSLFYKLIARGLCERTTTKPPHVYRVTEAGREALGGYLAAARQ